MSHVSSFLAHSDVGTRKRERERRGERWREQREGERRRARVYVVADSLLFFLLFFSPSLFAALLLADLLPPSVSFSRFAPRLSRAEKEA